MSMIRNTVLITGGGPGIGQALAEAFHALENKVIIAGRREAPLHAVSKRNPGMEYVLLDQSRPESIPAFAADMRQRFQS